MRIKIITNSREDRTMEGVNSFLQENISVVSLQYSTCKENSFVQHSVMIVYEYFKEKNDE